MDSNMNQNMVNTYINNDDEMYVKAYIGEKYDTLKKQKFSIAGFFFGPIYLFSKKLGSYALLLTILNVIITCLGIAPLLVLPISIIIGISFPKTYLNKVKERVNKIKDTLTSEDEIIRECKRQGGISSPILWTLGYICIYAILFIILLPSFK